VKSKLTDNSVPLRERRLMLAQLDAYLTRAEAIPLKPRYVDLVSCGFARGFVLWTTA